MGWPATESPLELSTSWFFFPFFTFIEFQVITELLPGDQVYVVAEGFLDDSADNRYQADGYTSFTGVQIRSGLQ